LNAIQIELKKFQHCLPIPVFFLQAVSHRRVEGIACSPFLVFRRSLAIELFLREQAKSRGTDNKRLLSFLSLICLFHRRFTA
jgi:hypothetical protein